jgi:hypothetical protein
LGVRNENSSRIQRFKTFGDTIVGLTHSFTRDPSDSYDPLPANSVQPLSVVGGLRSSYLQLEEEEEQLRYWSLLLWPPNPLVRDTRVEVRPRPPPPAPESTHFVTLFNWAW